MKKVIIALVLLATVSSTYAVDTVLSPFTGLKKGTDWPQFVKTMETDAAALTTFAAVLQLDTAGLVPGTGVATWIGTPTSANFLAAITNETGSGVVVGSTAPTITAPLITTSIRPTTDDGAPLGDTTHNWSDLFLASGAVINIDNGNWAATHTSGILTVGTGDLRVTTAGTNAASVVTVDGTQTLANKTLTAPVIGVATGTSLAATGLIKSSGTAGVGYATGAGGTVTQGTSRTTTVVLSKTSGQITTTADSMAAQTPTTFTVTNTLVAATDVIIISKVSGDVDTFAWVNSVGAGSYTITLFNTHASGADTTATVLNVVVIKGVTS
jgi:hypothetical protein